jgi:hypothetical protein
MTETNGSGRRPYPSKRLLALMVAEGFGEAFVWQQKAGGTSGEPPGEPPDDEKTNEAKRQAEQKIRDKEAGLARCYAKTPDDDDARSIVSLVGNTIRPLHDKTALHIRTALRLTIEHPQSVFIGEKVRALRGVRSVVVRRLIGAVDGSANA